MKKQAEFKVNTHSDKITVITHGADPHKKTFENVVKHYPKRPHYVLVHFMCTRFFSPNNKYWFMVTSGIPKRGNFFINAPMAIYASAELDPYHDNLAVVHCEVLETSISAPENEKIVGYIDYSKRTTLRWKNWSGYEDLSIYLKERKAERKCENFQRLLTYLGKVEFDNRGYTTITWNTYHPTTSSYKEKTAPLSESYDAEKGLAICLLKHFVFEDDDNMYNETMEKLLFGDTETVYRGRKSVSYIPDRDTVLRTDDKKLLAYQEKQVAELTKGKSGKSASKAKRKNGGK